MMNSSNHDVAVIGIGMRFPGANNQCTKNPSDLWDAISNGCDLLSQLQPDRYAQSYVDQGFVKCNKGGFVSMDEWKNFDPMFFGMTKKEAEQIDPQIRLLLIILWEAIEDAHLQYDKIRGSNTAVYIGTMTQGYKLMTNSEFTDMSPYSLAGNILTFVSNRLSYAFDFRGPSMTLDTACSSSLNAAYLGINSIRSGVCEMAVIGGCNDLIEPSATISLSNLSALSKTGKCHSFDAAADGYVRAEGAGICILKRLDAAVRDGNRIYGVIKGGSSNVDGSNNKTTLTAPSSTAQAENVVLALKDANISASDIYYVEAHGTGTPVGDPTEVGALANIFKDNHSPENPLRIGSIKSNMGHLEAAAGVASLIKVSLMLKNRQLVPSINFKTPNPGIKCNDWNIKVQTQLESFPSDKTVKIGINCFGLGGSNCHLILEEYKPNSTKSDTDKISNSPTLSNSYLIPFSGNTKSSVEKYISLIKGNVDNLSKSIPFEDFVRYQVESKSHFSVNRKIVAASSWQDFQKQEKTYSANDQDTSLGSFSHVNKLPVVFVFCGQGPQFSTMGLELYSSDPVFRNAVDECDNILFGHFGYSVIGKLRTFKGPSENEIHKPINAQPSIFLIQIGLLAMYKHWGIDPSIVVGHSFGEVTAAYCAKYISLETAAKIVYYRATLQNETIGSGRMLSIGMSSEEYLGSYFKLYPLEIACFNSSDSIVVTGDEVVLNQLVAHLKDKNILAIMLTTPCSFHSSKQEAIKDKLYNSAISKIEYLEDEDCDIKLFSTVTGTPFEKKQDYDINYIYSNLRQPVVLDKTIGNIVKFINGEQSQNKPAIFIEISPHPTLLFYLKKLIPKPSTIISSINRKGSDIDNFQNAVAQVYIAGSSINFNNQFSCSGPSNGSWKDRTSILPRYQFNTTPLWSEQLSFKKIRLQGPTNNHLGHKLHTSTGGFSYLSVIDVGRAPFEFIKGHKVKGQSLFPGTGYVDNILRALKGNDVYVHNLDFKYPFFLKEGVQHHLQSNFTEVAKNEYTVDFMFKENHNTDEWHRSAAGRVSVYPPMNAAALSKVDVSAIRRSCNYAKLNHDEVYQKIKNSGIEFGSSFSRIKSALMGPGCCLSTINMNPPVSDFDNETFFNTPILDSCAQGLIAIVNPTELVFEGLRNMKIFSNNVPSSRPDHIYVYVQIVSNSADTCIGKVQVFLEDGSLLMTCEKMVCHFIKKIEKDIPTNPNKTLFVQNWQRKELLQSTIQTSNLTINEYVCQLLATLKSNNDQIVVKLLDWRINNANSQKLLTEIEKHVLKPYPNIYLEFTVIGADSLVSGNDRLLLKCRSKPNIYGSLLKSGYDVVLTSDSSNVSELEQLLAHSGQLIITSIVPNSSLSTHLKVQRMIGGFTVVQNNTILSQPDIKGINKIAFITSGINPNDIESALIDQGLLCANKIEIFQSSTLVSKPERFIKFVGDVSKCYIVFLAGLEQLTVENYQQRTFEFVKLNQLLLQHNATSCHTILTTLNAQMDSTNFFNRSLVGIYRYFVEFNQLSITSIDLSVETLNEVSLSYLIKLSDIPNDKEYAIRLEGSPNRSLLSTSVQRIFKKPITPQKTDDSTLINSFIYKLNSNLEFEIKEKEEELTDSAMVEVRVMAVGINPMDKLYYLKEVSQEMLVSGDIYNPPFGLEFSGVVTKVFKQTGSKFKVGSQVVGLGYAAMASHVVVNEDWIVHKPSSLSFTQAASIPVDFISAYISAFVMGYLDNSESILIHMANHGVGRALLAFLKSKGHQGRIYITTDGDESATISEFKDIVTGSFSQVDLAAINNGFTEHIKSTGGVDIIINTLSSGSFIKSNFDCLSASGRIIDMSTQKLMNNENLNVKNFSLHRGYQTFHIDQLLTSKPKLINKHLNRIISMFGANQLDANRLGINTFPCSQIKDAFQLTTSNKTVIDFSQFDDLVVSPLKSNGKLEEKANSCSKMNKIGNTLLITGQTGIALVILRWIIDNRPVGLKDIVVLSRSKLKWELEFLINQLKHSNCGLKIHYRSVDVSNYNSLKESVHSIYANDSTVQPVSSAIHFATVYDYTEPQSISPATLSPTHNAKAVGAFNLHLLFESLGWKLNSFTLFSSVFSILGSANQSAYTSANSVLDALAEYRRSQGLCGLSVSWGALNGGGEVANNKAVSSFLKMIGFEMVSVGHILGGMKLFLNEPIDNGHLILVEMTYKPLFEQFKLFRSQLEHLSKVEHIDYEEQAVESDNTAGNSPFEMISFKVAELLSVSQNKLNPDTHLKDYGIDSLLTVQLKNWIQKEFNISNITTKQITNSSINTLLQSIK